MGNSVPEREEPMADSFSEAWYGPLPVVAFVAPGDRSAPSEEDVWNSWDRRCLYVGDEPFDPDLQRWPQWLREPYPALHSAYAVRLRKRPVIEVARTYPSPIQVETRHDREPVKRGKTGERLMRRGDRLWALIGAWPWASDAVRDRALGEDLPLDWTWNAEELRATMPASFGGRITAMCRDTDDDHGRVEGARYAAVQRRIGGRMYRAEWSSSAGCLTARYFIDGCPVTDGDLTLEERIILAPRASTGAAAEDLHPA
jgi:hypothetical protein